MKIYFNLNYENFYQQPYYCPLCRLTITNDEVDHEENCSHLANLYKIRHTAVQNDVTLGISKQFLPKVSVSASKFA